MRECPKCKGTGYLEKYIRVQHGKCFRCDGTGKVEGTPKNFYKVSEVEYPNVRAFLRSLKDNNK